MFDLKLKILALAALLLLVPILLAACGDDDADTAAGLSREEVREIVRSDVAASAPAPAQAGLIRAEAEAAIQAAIAGMPAPEASLTEAEVEAAIQAAMAAMSQPEPGLTPAEVEAAILAAIAVMPQPEPGLASAKVEELIQAEAGLAADEARRLAQYAVATVPPKSAPAEYTIFFVNNAISRYETEGLEATLAH